MHNQNNPVTSSCGNNDASGRSFRIPKTQTKYFCKLSENLLYLEEQIRIEIIQSIWEFIVQNGQVTQS